MEWQPNIETAMKIVLIGDGGVGKTTLNCSYITGEAMLEQVIPTIGAAFFSKKIEKYGHKLKLDIWDTAGQERFRALTNIYCRDASGCLCVFDLTDEKSFKHLDRWMMRFNDGSSGSSCIVVVANKCDVDEKNWKVSRNEINIFSEDYKLPVLYASGKTGIGVQNAYDHLVDLLISENRFLYKKEIGENIISLVDDKLEQTNSSCAYC